jgi:hypothetical protein
MDGIRELLETARTHGLVDGHLRGLLHIAIGRRVSRTDGTLLSTGLTWRELASLLKQLRFDKELVRELGAEPEELAPRDRNRFWYSAIALARVDAPEAVAEAEAILPRLKEAGFVIGPNPTAVAPARLSTPAPTTQAKSKVSPSKEKPQPEPAKEEKSIKRKKKG